MLGQLTTHLDEEESDVVPLIAEHVSVAEWGHFSKTAFDKFTPAQRFTAMGQMLEVATPDEAAAMLAPLPAAIKLLWRLVGKQRNRQVRRGVPRHTRGGSPVMTRAAGVLALLLGLGFGIPGFIGTRQLAQHHEIWRFLGFPTYGEGPFERAGIPTTVPLIASFVLVCAAQVGLGALLLAGWRPALWLSLALLPFELAYWTGFALPYGFVLGAARVALTTAVLVRGS